jgi:hypothetical protein
MKKISVTISFDEEKLAALKMYLAQKNMQVESELEHALDSLYIKNVPTGVREFIEMKSGVETPPPKPKKLKTSSLSAVVAVAQEGGSNEAQ